MLLSGVLMGKLRVVFVDEMRAARCGPRRKMHRSGVNKKLHAIVNCIFQCQKSTPNSEFLPEYGLWEIHDFAFTMPALIIVARLRAFTVLLPMFGFGICAVQPARGSPAARQTRDHRMPPMLVRHSESASRHQAMR
jgi:hypothetical protein